MLPEDAADLAEHAAIGREEVDLLLHPALEHEAVTGRRHDDPHVEVRVRGPVPVEGSELGVRRRGGAPLRLVCDPVGREAEVVWPVAGVARAGLLLGYDSIAAVAAEDGLIRGAAAALRLQRCDQEREADKDL
jgi:hypothetical protein